MRFPHEDPEFDELLRIAADGRRISVAMAEKDYWVTHALWSLEAQGFEVWFKGGTSLSKGFGLIERFSEDLDLKLEPGAVSSVPTVANWKSENSGPIAARRAHFEALVRVLVVPGARVELIENDKKWRGAKVAVRYPGKHLGALDTMLSPYVLLELGDARVRPAIERSMSSFVRDVLEERGMLGEYDTDNRPTRVRCVHPLVTLLEKVDALGKRVPDERVEPATFVRHFEDAARVIERVEALPPLPDYADVRALAAEMLEARQLVVLPCADGVAFAPDAGPRWQAIRAAHRAIQPMFWGPRVPIEDACASIRRWLMNMSGTRAE